MAYQPASGHAASARQQAGADAGIPREGQVQVRLMCAPVDGGGVRVAQAAVRSVRPQQVGRLVLGRPVADVLRLLPMLYSLCGQAHVAAFRMAAQAAGHDAGPQVIADDAASRQGAAAVASASAAAATSASPRALRAGQDAPLLLEMMREHLVQLLLGWPQVLQAQGMAAPAMQPKLQEAMPLLRSLASLPTDEAGRARLAGEMPRRVALLLGEEASAFLQRDAAALQRWQEQSSSFAACLLRHVQDIALPSMPALPPLAMADLPAVAAQLQRDAQQAAHFCAWPVLDGQCRVSGVLQRWRQHVALQQQAGVAAAVLARLLDVALLALLLAGEQEEAAAMAASGMQDGTLHLPQACTLQVRASADTARVAAGAQQDVLRERAQAADCMGIAAVDTARGLLVHALMLDDEGRVQRWHVLAPTEWHCHPDGLAARWLHGLKAADAAKLRQRAQLLMQVVDPCVGCSIELQDASPEDAQLAGEAGRGNA